MLGLHCLIQSHVIFLSISQPRKYGKNKLRWYPQQPQHFIFTNMFKKQKEEKQTSPEPSPEPVEPDLALHQSLPPDLALHQRFPKPSPEPPEPSPEPCFPDLLQNLLRSLVEPDPAPAPVHTGAILG